MWGSKKFKPLSIALLLLIACLLVGCSGSADDLISVSEIMERENVSDTYSVLLERAKVVRVIDGDTAVMEVISPMLPEKEIGIEERVRFIGINTPESTTRHEPYGEEASEFTKKALAGKMVYLEKDVSNRDRYDRLLRYVWLEEPKTGSEEEIRTKMFNAILVLEGYAQAATYPPDVKYSDYFVQFQKEARSQNLGLWGLD